MKLRHARLNFPSMGLAAFIVAGACASTALDLTPARSQGAATSPATSDLDAGVAAALREMAETLAGTPELTVWFSSLREAAMRAGSDQQVMLGGTVAVGIRRPDQLAALVGSDRGSFRLWYDGEVATLLSLTANAYARRAIPGDIDTMLEALETRLGVQVPLRDLLTADPFAALTEDGTTGVPVGRTLVNGVACDQYALRNRHVDWQIWIASEEPRLPCRLVVVERNVPGAPRAVLEFFDWNLAPGLEAETFTFEAPSDAQEVVWLERPASSPAAETR
ncbi:DUF2092 domain-containing protein [Falsiroseomonas sp. HC035]|uniref:DUF2092 domain-containing protein n=1 Tax=Falsiroseomonas sp. HC035 TaxID=3390999 RepID=UPI003D317903